MNTYTPYSLVVETYTFPSAPDAGTVSASVHFETGDAVALLLTPTLVSGNQYTVSIIDDVIDSSGLYRIKWSCEISGESFYDYTTFNVEEIYISFDTFINNNPEYDIPEYTVKFYSNEKIARRIIDTYTGQNFQFIKNKTKNFEGNGRSKLYLGDRLNFLNQILIAGEDFTDSVSIDLRSKYFVKLEEQDVAVDSLDTRVFPKDKLISVRGDWGWLSVPWEIEQAAELLIYDLMSDVRRENRRYGIRRIEQDSHRLEFDPSILNSTGNIDVDTLLMDYVIWTMDYVY